jgi:hypothetical protein
MHRRSLIALAGLGLWLATAPAHASLTGSSITGSDHFGNTTTPYPYFTLSPLSSTVGDGREAVMIMDFDTGISINFTASSLVPAFTYLTSVAPASFNGMQFSLISGNRVSDVLSALDAARQTMTATAGKDVSQLTLAGESLAADDVVTITFAATGIPAPASFGLLGAGLLAFQAVRRRRQPAAR